MNCVPFPRILLRYAEQAIFDNKVDYLEILLDHAVAAQEQENESKMNAMLNGEMEPPVREGQACHDICHDVGKVESSRLTALYRLRFRTFCPP